jgi:large subunit ribosomal protein L13
VTGSKLDDKVYYWHSGYPGGLKSRTLRQQLDKFPARVVETAVKGMLPKNKMGRKMRRKLKVYAGNSHPHQAQKPKVLELWKDEA